MQECLILNCIVMARPIEETPIMTGEDARRFVQRIREKHRATDEEYEQMMKAYEIGKKIFKCD
jgi:hypothetical protein